MISVDVADALIVVAMSGTVSDEDWDAAVFELDEKLGCQASVHLTLEDAPKLKMLIDWEKLDGWEKGTRSTCTWFCMGNQDMIDRLAVICDDRWRDETERLVDIYKNAQINVYYPRQRDLATNWLSQASK